MGNDKKSSDGKKTAIVTNSISGASKLKPCIAGATKTKPKVTKKDTKTKD